MPVACQHAFDCDDLFAGSAEGTLDQPVRPVQIAMKATTSRAAGSTHKRWQGGEWGDAYPNQR